MISDNISFYKMQDNQEMEERERIIDQIRKEGFTGDLKVYHLGYDSEDSISLVIEGFFQGEKCCYAVGYGMNRQRLALRQKWRRLSP
jgi:hypothetical protein